MTMGQEMSTDLGGQQSVSSAVVSSPSTCRSPPLPIELWIMVIECIDNPYYQRRGWLDFRLVSSMFKEATERAAKGKIMRQMKITYAFHLEPPRTVLGLDEYSDSAQRAIFRPLAEARTTLAVPDPAIALARPHMERYEPASEMPRNFISLPGIFNDTELPGLEVDLAKHTISFLWMPMLSKLFAEEDCCSWLIAKHPDFRFLSSGYSCRLSITMLWFPTPLQTIAGEVFSKLRRLRHLRQSGNNIVLQSGRIEQHTGEHLDSLTMGRLDASRSTCQTIALPDDLRELERSDIKRIDPELIYPCQVSRENTNPWL
ncbi:hypothetical protein F4780DRAFT_614149 [Xylariomycetidae sp. FL0641]|nr:hypothetical protein F4780DRAFT_614149 [Xylariomycetidae sp. FL0641]